MKEKKRSIIALLAPMYIFTILFVGLPILYMFLLSFLSRAKVWGVDFTFTLGNYKRILEPLYLEMFIESFRLAALTTVFVFIIGYPYGYIMARMNAVWKKRMMLLLMIPFWTSALIRLYGWIIVFRSNGVLDKLLMIQLRRRWPEARIICMVRGADILNDVTREDATQVGIDQLFEVVDNGTSTPGTWIPSLPAETLALLKSADVILSKGQANIECLCGCGLNIYYLLLCKCSHFANLFSVERYTGMFINESDAGKLM